MEESKRAAAFNELQLKKRENKAYQKAYYVVEEILNKDKGVVESTQDIINTDLVHVSKHRTISLCQIKDYGKWRTQPTILSKELQTKFFVNSSAAAIIFAKAHQVVTGKQEMNIGNKFYSDHKFYLIQGNSPF